MHFVFNRKHASTEARIFFFVDRRDYTARLNSTTKHDLPVAATLVFAPDERQPKAMKGDKLGKWISIAGIVRWVKLHFSETS